MNKKSPRKRVETPHGWHPIEPDTNPTPFNHFNPEALQEPIADSYAITALVHRAAALCSGNGDAGRISNDEIARIIRYVPLYDSAPPLRHITSEDFSPAAPDNLNSANRARFEAARALLLIDETLAIVKTNGWIAQAVDRMLLAAAWAHNALELQHDADILNVGALLAQQQAEASQNSGKDYQHYREQTAMKEQAAQWYDAAEGWGVWQSIPKAVVDLIPQVEAWARGRGFKDYRFAPTNARRTLSDHLREHVKKKQQHQAKIEAETQVFAQAFASSREHVRKYVKPKS